MTETGEARLELYADGGVLARWWPLRLSVPTPVVVLLGALPPVLALASQADVGPAVLAALVWWVVVIETSAPTEGPLAWLFPPLVRAGEYGFAVAVVALGAPDALPALFLVLCALSYHHYDIVYRVRQIGVRPPGWLELALLGRSTRLGLIAGAAAIEIAEPVLWTLGGYLTLVGVGESMTSWRQAFREGEIT